MYWRKGTKPEGLLSYEGVWEAQRSVYPTWTLRASTIDIYGGEAEKEVQLAHHVLGEVLAAVDAAIIAEEAFDRHPIALQLPP